MLQPMLHLKCITLVLKHFAAVSLHFLGARAIVIDWAAVLG